MKKVIFDLFTSQPKDSKDSKFTGGGEYAKTVFKAVVENNEDADLYVLLDKNRFIDNWVTKIIDTSDIHIVNVTCMQDIQVHLDSHHYNVFYSPIPYEYSDINFKNCDSTIGTFHGIRAIEKYTDQYESMYTSGIKATIKAKAKKILNTYIINNRIKPGTYQSLINFSTIVCDSEHTKYSLVNAFPKLEMNKVNVLYAPNKYIDNTETVKNFNHVSNKFILIIGNDRWLKNGYRGILALEGLFNNAMLSDYQVVLVGKISEKIKKKIKHINRYILLDYVSAPTLEFLYQKCDVFLYPSLNEGFGYPPIEAMKYGTTCIVGADTSLTEICGNVVYYVNPYDIMEIGTRILEATNRKINSNKIINYYRSVSEKQNEDLLKLSKMILGKS